MSTPGVTLTYTLTDVTEAGKAGKVTLTLLNYGTLPQIANTAIVADTYYTSYAASNGSGSVTFWGNYQFTFANSYYQIQVYGVDANGKINVTPTWTANYVFMNGGSFDLSEINPIVVAPGAPIVVGGIGVSAINGLQGGVTLAGGTDISVTTSGQTINLGVVGISGIPVDISGISAGGYLTYNGTVWTYGTPVTLLNDLEGEVLLEAGSNITITPSGNTLSIASTGGGEVYVNNTLANPSPYNADFNNSTPAAPSDNTNVTWQTDSEGHISAYYATSGTTVPFNAVTSGTNTTATMTVGSGGELTFGTGGIVNANEIYGVVVNSAPPSTGQVLTATSASAASWQTGSQSFDGISSGTNTTATMVVGTGAQLTPSGSGVITATGLTGSPAIVVSSITATNIDGGALSGTFTGNPTVSGSPTFSGNPNFTGEFLAGGSHGTSGQLLSSTGTGVTWVNPSSSVAFSAITAGTNMGAGTLTVGTGTTLTYANASGAVINANQIGGNLVNTSSSPATGQALVWTGSSWSPSTAANVSFAGIQTGTNTGATMTVSSGSTLTFLGSGVINANEIQGVPVSSTSPSGGQVLTFVGPNAQWQTPSGVSIPWSSLQNPNANLTLDFAGVFATTFKTEMASTFTSPQFFLFQNTTAATSGSTMHAPGVAYQCQGWNGSASVNTSFTTDFRFAGTEGNTSLAIFSINDINNAQTNGIFSFANQVVMASTLGVTGTVTTGANVNATTGFTYQNTAPTGHLLIGNGTGFIDGGTELSFAVSGSNSNLSVGTSGGSSNGVIILGSTSGGGQISVPGVEAFTIDATTINIECLGFTVNTSVQPRLSIDSTGAWNLGALVAPGASGQVITSQGSGTPPIWANVAGSGTVNSGLANQLAYYATSTNAVSGTVNATISGGALTLGVADTTPGSIVLNQGTTNIDAITISAAGATASYTFTLPATGGTNGYALTTNGSGTTSWSSVLTNPMTTTGDIIYSSSGSTPARLGIGTTGYVLTVVGGVPAWASNTGGSAFSAITAGTNTAALVVGTGGTLKTSGTGNNVASNGTSFNNVVVSGAVGNGSTNDHTAIQAAFTATGSTNPGVFFPATASSENYVNSTACTDPSTGDLQFIKGSGDLSGLITAGTNNLLTLTHVTDNTGIAGFVIEDISFTGNTTPTSIGTQSLVNLSNVNSNSGGTDVSGLQMRNVQLVNSAGPGLTVDQPILANIQNVTAFGCAQGIVYTNAGTTVTHVATYMNQCLAQGYQFNQQQCIAMVGTAMDSNGTGVDFNSATCIGMVGIDGESSVPWLQTITNVVLTSGTATITVANTYAVGDTVLIIGGTSTNAPLNGRWKVATRSSSQFTFATTAANISTNAPAGMKSSVECGDLIRMRGSAVNGGSLGLCVSGVQAYLPTVSPTIAQSALLLVDGFSGLSTIGGYINNSAGITHDVYTMPGAGGMFYHSCNFGATTEANAIYAVGTGSANAGGGANYVGINNTFGSAQITPPIMLHIVAAGNPAPATAGAVIENGTSFASSIPMLTLTQHNAGDTGNVLTINNSGTASNDISATNWTMSQAGKIAKYGGAATAGQGTAPIYFTAQSNNLTANYNSGSAKTLVTPTVSGQTFRIVAMQAISQAATSSSTLPSLTIGWTDSTAVARTLVLLPTSATNTTAVYETGTCLVTTNASTPVTATSASYASSGATTMDYNLTIVLEQLI